MPTPSIPGLNLGKLEFSHIVTRGQGPGFRDIVTRTHGMAALSGPQTAFERRGVVVLPQEKSPSETLWRASVGYSWVSSGT